MLVLRSSCARLRARCLLSCQPPAAAAPRLQPASWRFCRRWWGGGWTWAAAPAARCWRRRCTAARRRWWPGCWRPAAATWRQLWSKRTSCMRQPAGGMWRWCRPCWRRRAVPAWRAPTGAAWGAPRCTAPSSTARPPRRSCSSRRTCAAAGPPAQRGSIRRQRQKSRAWRQAGQAGRRRRGMVRLPAWMRPTARASLRCTGRR